MTSFVLKPIFSMGEEGAEKNDNDQMALLKIIWRIRGGEEL